MSCKIFWWQKQNRFWTSRCAVVPVLLLIIFHTSYTSGEDGTQAKEDEVITAKNTSISNATLSDSSVKLDAQSSYSVLPDTSTITTVPVTSGSTLQTATVTPSVALTVPSDGTTQLFTSTVSSTAKSVTSEATFQTDTTVSASTPLSNATTELPTKVSNATFPSTAIQTNTTVSASTPLSNATTELPTKATNATIPSTAIQTNTTVSASTSMSVATTEPSTETTNTTVPVSSNKFSIYFVNDLQYDIFPIDLLVERKTVCEAEDSKQCIGGVGRLKSFIEDKLKANSNALWLNAGNTVGGEWFKILKYHTAVEALKYLHFNASAVGPDVFKYGLKATEDFLEELHSMILISNAVSSSVKKSLNFSIGNCNVSVIGFLDDPEKGHELHQMILEGSSESITKTINLIRSEQQDASKLITIALGSTSRDRAKTLANIDGIDILLYSGGCTSAVNNSCWDMMDKTTDKKTYVWSLGMNHSDIEARFLVGELQINLGDNCAIESAIPAVFDYSRNYTSDANVSNLISHVAKLKDLSESLTVNARNMSGENNKCQFAECSLGNLVADAMVAAVRDKDFWDENATRIAVFPADLLEPSQAVAEGDLSAMKLYGLFKEDSYIYTVQITAENLAAILQMSIRSSLTNSSNFLHISDLLQIQYNKTAEKDLILASVKTVLSSSNAMSLSSIKLDDKSTVLSLSVPFSLLKMEDYKTFLMSDTDITYHNFTVVESLIKHINNTEFLSLPVVGLRQLMVEYQPLVEDELECSSNPGITITVTLVLTAVFLGGCYGVWWYLFRRRRGRSSSTMAMMNLD